MPGIRGPGRSRPGWPRPWARTASHRSPAGLLRRPGTSDQEIRLLYQGRARLPRRQQEAQARHAPLRRRLTALRPPPLGPTTSANATKTKRFRPGRPRPGPPPHPDPARHDPQRHPLQPTTINTATRSRLTHHTGHVASRTPPRSASNASSAPSNPSRTSPSTSTDTTSSRSPDPRSRRHPHRPQHPNRALKLCN